MIKATADDLGGSISGFGNLEREVAKVSLHVVLLDVTVLDSYCDKGNRSG